MKLVDVNVLLYVVNQDDPLHPRVRKWWETCVADEQPVGLTWITILGFLRLSTRTRVFSTPLTPRQAIAKIQTWLNLPNISLISESEQHWTILQQLLDELGTAGNLTSDAHLAAIALSLGASVVSCDADFARFRLLRWENPLTQ